MRRPGTDSSSGATSRVSPLRVTGDLAPSPSDTARRGIARTPSDARRGTVERVARSLAVATVILLGLALPSVSLADHCDGSATVEPGSGPAGTTFVFRTNLGETSNLYLYHDGELVRTDTLAGGDATPYRIRTDADDIGRWRIRAAVQGGEACYGEAVFRVTGMPDTATDAGGSGAWTSPVVTLAGLLGLMLAGWHWSGRTMRR